MTTEAIFERMFTPVQLENQRLFRVGPVAMPEQPGDKGKRVIRKAAIFAGATAADLAESWGAEKVLKKIEDKFVTNIQDETRKARNHALFSGVQFVEDGASDELYVLGMNAILRGITGLEAVSYASPLSRWISGWTNLGSYVSGRFSEEGRVFWKKPWNVVNAVNVEAAIGLLEEMPFVGKGVEKAHTWANAKIAGSEAFQFLNGVATGAVTGYHIDKNMIQSNVRKALTKAAPVTSAPTA